MPVCYFYLFFHINRKKEEKMDCVPVCSLRKIEDTFTERYRCCADGDRIRTVTLDFGQVPVGDTLVKAVKICNVSCNEESYEVHRDPITNPLDAVFHFHKYSRTVASNSSIVCRVLYRPVLPSQRSVDYFTIVNCEREILKLIVRGESIGPNVVVSSERLVMICAPGGSVKKRVKIINDSDVPANFMFDVDEKQSSCKPAPTEGCVRARSHVYVVVTFEPAFEGPQSLYLPCLIQHQAPIMMRIYGYCGKKYTTEVQFDIPTIVYPPEENDGFEGYMSDNNRVRSGDARLSVHPISLSNNYLDFGRVDAETQDTTLRPPRTTSFANHSQTDMLVKWHEDVEGIFDVSPHSARVKAGEAYLCEVRFDPTEENAFYTRELTALVFWMNSEDSVPIYSYPMIASIRVMGHTFPVGSSSWIPQYRVPQSIIMPACLPSRPVYATFLIRRFGHLPLMFRFVPPNETRFTVKPMLGVIYNNYQVIVVEMFPEDQSKLLYERWAIRFNGNPDYEASVDFRGYAEFPSVTFGGDVINFSATHPGCQQVKCVSVRNTSRHHITYRYEDVPSVLNVDQVRGQICANEILIRNWTFCPLEEDDYEFDVSCCFAATTTRRGGESTMEIQVHVAGKSERGYLVAMPSELNFEELTHDETRKLDFQLINPSSVEIPYILTFEDNRWPYEGDGIQRRVLIDPISGTLCPGDSEKIQVRLAPQKRGFHEFSIQYSVRPNSKVDTLTPMNEPVEICKIKYYCVLPTINVEDLLDHRLGPNISKDVLWRLLNLKKLNSILNGLQAGENGDLEMHLPPKVLQDEALFVKLLISNPTSTLTTWSLKQRKICSCSKIRETRGRNSRHMRYTCSHRDLCTIDPRSGTLKAHEKVVITMVLRYATLGENNLKWDLDIGRDRHICLSIKMIALSGNEQKAILLYGSRLELKKIYVGDRDPINQICWIYNPTQNEIAYSVDTTAFEKANEDHRSEMFSCANPSGRVRALSYEPILIKFQPRRWGTFEVIVPLMLGNERTTITIKGESTNDPSTRISEKISPFHDAFHIPEVPVYFNTDNITLPPTPMHSRVTRMIMIHNNLQHEVVAYKWRRYELPGIVELKVEPETGRFQPGSLQTFRLIVVTGGKPCRFNADVTCEFINQSQKRAYEKKIFIHDSLCEEMKDYFTITERGTSVPKPEELVLEAPKPFDKALTVRCYIYSPQDEELKTSRNERLKHTPPIEIPVDKGSAKLSASRETIALSKFILEGMIWDILQTTSVCVPSSCDIRYSQIAMTPLQRNRIQDRSRVRPSGRMLERLLENMIFMIVHKEFALDMIHLTQTTDARQVAYQKMWQQVPSRKGLDPSQKSKVSR